MDFLPVTDEQRRRFNEEGYLIVPDVLDTETIEALTIAGDLLISSDRKDKRQRKADGLFDGFRNCLSLDDAFIPLLAQPTILPLVLQLMGPNLHLTTSHLIYQQPDPPGASPNRRIPAWHRDIANTVNDLGHAHVPRMQVKCAYYLTDATQPNSGATLVLPGSHLLKKALEIPEGEVDPPGAVEPKIRAGDCMIFEQRLWHSGGANISHQPRKAVMFGYGYRWMKPADYLRQSASLTEKLSPIERFLVGEKQDQSKAFQVGGGFNPLEKWGRENGFTYEPPA